MFTKLSFFLKEYYSYIKFIIVFVLAFYLVTLISPRDYDLYKYYAILDRQAKDEDIPIEKLKLDADALSHCRTPKKGESQEQCFIDFYKKYTIENGPGKAFLHLGSMLDFEPGLLPGCHYIAHGIGEGAYVKNKGDLAKSYRFDVSKVFSNVASCGNGYYHGVSIGLTRTTNTDDGLYNLLKGFCDKPAHWGGYGENACNHGLGHAITIYYSHDRTKSIAMCHRLLDEDFDNYGNKTISGCLGGVMMEYAIMLDTVGIDFPYVSGLKELCKDFAQGTEERETCVLEGAGVARRDTDFIGAAKACDTMDSRTDRLACTKLQVVHAVRIFRSQQLKQVCNYTRSYQDKIECVSVIATYLANAVDLRDLKVKRVVMRDVCHTLNIVGYLKCMGLLETNKNTFVTGPEYGVLPTWEELKMYFLYNIWYS